MNIPEFIGCQEAEEEYPVVGVDAQRIVTDFNGAYAKISLQTVTEIIALRRRKEDPTYVATEILLQRGEYFGAADSAHAINMAAHDVEKLSRRHKGNQLVVHDSNKKAFETFFPDYDVCGYKLHTSDHPKLISKLIVLYTANTNQDDSGLIMAYHIDSHSYGFSVAHTELYTRIMDFDGGPSTSGYSIHKRRIRKEQWN